MGGAACATGDEDIGMLGFLQLPSTVPWWLLLAALIPVGLYVLLFLAIPFSVFGLKGRLESIEARLDDMHADIRGVALQLAERGLPESDHSQEVEISPPILPARGELEVEQPRGRAVEGSRSRDTNGPRTRSEPRLDWPR
jgi:hypothetical protein